MMLRFVLLLLLVATGAVRAQSITLHHVHGLAYTGEGKRLVVPSHHGLAVYENGRWSKAPGPEHDYMGFVSTAKHFYSSGHPAPRSGWKEPFGLIRSRDGGKTWDSLGLAGETDFHLLAAGWNTNAIYVWNPEPSSRMKARGLHFTLNEGFTWSRAAAKGLAGKPHALAVHPDDPASVALATSQGLYLSRDSGERFERIAAGGEALAAFFDLDGAHLWYGAYANRATLARLSLKDRSSTSVSLPPLPQDAVAYIAQNPAARHEYAIATFERSIFLSKDAGKTWSQLASRGATR